MHARRWLETGARGAQGILKGAACGFAAAVLVLLPGIVTAPMHAPPYVIAYGRLAAVVGLAIGAGLWISATLTLALCARHAGRAAVSLDP